MSAQTTPIGMDLSKAAEKRNAMVAQNMKRLKQLAYKAMYIRKMRNDEFVVVCILVDSPYRDIVDLLMPNFDWQKIRDMGQEPLAKGTASFSLCNILAEIRPDIAGALREKPSEGYVKCIALDEGGCTVYEIEPAQEL